MKRSQRAWRFALPLALPLALALGPASSQAEITGGVIKVGLLSDLSSQYADYGGDMSILMARMAIEEMGGQIDGKKIELVVADHQQKVDVGVAIVRKWIDEDGVDVILEAGQSALAAAVMNVVKEKNKVFLDSAASSDLTGKLCNANSVQFTPDTYSQATVAATALVQRGLKSWYSVTVDYALGHALERDSLAVVKANGGTAAGSVRFPFNSADMSSYVLQAQASKAQVLSIAAGGGDVQSTLRAVNEYGVNKTMSVVALNIELLDTYKLGKKLLAGTYLTEYWYWDQDAQTRAFAKKVVERHPKHYYPSRSSTGLWSALLHYLRAVKELKSDADGKAVVDKMKQMPVNDHYGRGGRVREDGRLIKETYLAQVKTAEEAKGGDWDVYKILATVPGDKAFRPVSESECPLLKK